MLQITLNITESELRGIIEEAFDKGFHGCLDLKEEVVTGLMEHLSRRIVSIEHGRDVDIPCYTRNEGRIKADMLRNELHEIASRYSRERHSRDSFTQSTEWLNRSQLDRSRRSIDEERRFYSELQGTFSNEPMPESFPTWWGFDPAEQEQEQQQAVTENPQEDE